MEVNDVVILVLAEHIIEEIKELSKTLVLLKRPLVRIHIAHSAISTCDGIITYETTIEWNRIVDEVLSTKGDLLCKLLQSSIEDFRSGHADLLEKQYREFSAALMVVMMQEDITDYRIHMEPGRITIDIRLIPTEHKSPTMRQIVEETAKYYDLEVSSVFGKDRKAATARKVAMYLIRKITTHSLVDIEREFERDHTTVIYAIQKIDKEIKAGSESIKSAVVAIAKQLDALQ